MERPGGDGSKWKKERRWDKDAKRKQIKEEREVRDVCGLRKERRKKEKRGPTREEDKEDEGRKIIVKHEDRDEGERWRE